MKLVAQRVVRPSDGASGVNAYCYLHPGVQWLDAPPDDLGRGRIAGRLIEIPPPGNRVRSYLDILTPDTTSPRALKLMVLDAADMMAGAEQRFPWHLRHGETTLDFNLELALAQRWDLELRLLLGYALQAAQESASSASRPT